MITLTIETIIRMHKAFILKSILVLFFIQFCGMLNAQCISNNEMYFAGSTQMCQGGRAYISVIGDFEDYLWSNGDTDASLGTDSVGLYSLIVTDSLGCTLSSSVSIQFGTDLGLIIGGKNVACNIDSTRLYSGYNFKDYIWSTGDTTEDIQVYQTGTYDVTVTDFTGCVGRSSMYVRMESDTLVPIIVTCPGNGIPLEIDNTTNDPCDSSNPLLESSSGFPVALQWTALDDVLDFPGVATDDGNGGLPFLVEYRDNIIITSCVTSNTAFEIERTWKVSDGCGNEAECMQVIRLIDLSPPILLAGDAFFLNQDSNNPNGAFKFTSLYCPYTVNWTEPAFADMFDNCASNISVTSSHSPGSTFDQGITTISYILEDDCGNQNEYTFQIEIDCVGCNATSPVYEECDEPIAYCDLNEINNYSACTPEDTGQILGALCNSGALNNPSYFNFIAGSSSISLTVTPEVCTPGVNGFIGLQANVTNPCDASICYGTSGASCFDDVFSFQASGLTIGEEYQLVVDGCGGSECQWSLNINSAPTFNILQVGNFVTDNYNFPNCNNNNDNFCTGSEILFYPDNLIDSEFYFCWNINNTNGVTALNQSTNCLAAPNTVFNCNGDYSTCGPLLLSFDQVGTYTICLEEIENGCDNQTLFNYCYTVNITSSPSVNFGSYDVCESNMPWEPLVSGPNGETWMGNNSLVPGLNTITTEDQCGCTTTQTIIVNVIPDQTQNLFIDICQSNLTGFVDTQYGVTWADLQSTYNTQTNTASFNLSNGSSQTQYDGSSCGIQLNYQFFIYDINGSIIQLEGPACNATLEFNLDQSSLPSFIVESNIQYNWFGPNGLPVGSNRTIDVQMDGNYILNIEYDLPNGGTCIYPFQYNALGTSTALTVYYIDIDGDGFGNSNTFISDCTQPFGYTANPGDCNDGEPSIHPGAPEVPNNGIDENCDGIDTVTAVDNDNDGYTDDVDCNDNNPDINPNAVEIPNNNIDENCDGIILIIDLDGDGFNSDEDCNDANPGINPNADEIPNNNIDENCDGIILIIDNDGDGFNSDEDCDDNNPDINPDADEIPNNTIDENCDGLFLIVDADGDGWNSNSDCDDNNPDINPTAIEIPNNDIDEDCDGEALMIDEDNDGFNSDEDCDDNNPIINPDADEIPNNEIDEDCDGTILIIDIDGDGWNSDEDCDDSNSSINPDADEIPNNEIDEDCDGSILIIDIDGDGFNSSEDCDDNDPNINPDAEEIPNNGIDENCDGEDVIIDATHDLNGIQIDIYPNPTLDYIFVESEQPFLYKLFSTNRKIVLFGDSELKISTIDLTNLKSGIYLLIITDPRENKQVIERIVKI